MLTLSECIKNDVVLFQSCLLYILNVDEGWFVDEGRGIYEVPIFIGLS